MHANIIHTVATLYLSALRNHDPLFAFVVLVDII